MKKIEKYVSKDGAEFSTQEAAEHREWLLEEVDMINSLLPDKNDSTDFANGHGYIQHYNTSLFRAREKLVKLACQEVFTELKDYDLRSYAFGRYLNDSNSVLYGLYNRIVSCVDDSTLREYGQPYFANNPDKAENICLNP